MTTNAIDYFNSQSPLRSLASRVALHARRGIYARFVALAGTEPGQRLLDLGVTPDTSLLGSNFLERWYAYCRDITMASVEDCTALETVFPGMQFVRIQPDQALPFPNAYFDVGFSSAVLEHVGGAAQQRFLVQELLRTCRSVFLTTPDRAFPIEVHTFLPVLHCLPKRLHRRLLGWLGHSFGAAEANLNLLTRRGLAQLVAAARQAGFAAARTAYIVYADADLTYDFHEGPRLVKALRDSNADIAVGTRLQGQIEPGAMPVLHRRLGTPVLTALINLLFGSKLTDCNSGFRAFRCDRLTAWEVSSPGMEFASELLVNALRAGTKIAEVPITLHRDRRDGIRQLLTILARAPWLFLNAGLAIVVLSVLIAIMCAFGPRAVFGRFAVFDYDTLIFAVLLGFLGAQVFGMGLLLQLRRPRLLKGLTTKLLDLHEGVLFWLLAGIAAGVVGGVGFVAWSWAQHGFANIAYLKFTLVLLYTATVLGSLGMSLFYAQLLKRA